MKPLHENYDVVVIGGGFYGVSLALELAKKARRILIMEKESDLLLRASYVNQARVHQGYHYPRSLLTAHRSRVNFPKFVAEYNDAIDSTFKMVYGIAKFQSNVSASQFYQFCNRIGAPLAAASDSISRLFNANLIERVFEVKEFAFNADRLRALLKKKLKQGASRLCLIIALIASPRQPALVTSY